MNSDNRVDLLMQGRQLVHTSYEVTATQNRIFYYCLLNAQKEANGSFCCDVDIDKLKSLIPNTNQRTEASIKKSLSILGSTTVEFEVKDDDDDVECEYKLIAGFERYKKQDKYKIIFASRLYKHIINYTVYAPLNLNILTKFKSFYSQRLYELLRLWSRTDESVVKDFKVAQLRFILGVEDKYPEYKNFKQRALSQAIKEINEFGNMEVEMDEIKKGRKVDAIRFTILDHEKKTYFKDRYANVDKVIEVKSEDIVIKDTEDPSLSEKKPCADFYVPNKKLFTKKTLGLFINDFNAYDFKESEYKKILQEAILATLEKDDEEKVKDKAYKYFKAVLEDKLNKMCKGSDDKAECKRLKNRAHNVNNTFVKYGEDELERHLIENQKGKFKKTSFHNFKESFTRYTEDELEKIVLDQQGKHNTSNDLDLAERDDCKEIFNEAVRLLQEESPYITVNPESVAWKKVIEDKIKELLGA